MPSPPTCIDWQTLAHFTMCNLESALIPLKKISLYILHAISNLPRYRKNLKEISRWGGEGIFNKSDLTPFR